MMKERKKTFCLHLFSFCHFKTPNISSIHSVFREKKQKENEFCLKKIWTVETNFATIKILLQKPEIFIALAQFERDSINFFKSRITKEKNEIVKNNVEISFCKNF